MNEPESAAPETQDDRKLPPTVTKVEVEGREVYLIGTIHVSKKSVEDVQKTIEIVDPDAICVELCEPRLRQLTDSDNWKNLNLFKVLREGRAMLVLSSLIMSSFQHRIGKQLGVRPGAEQLEAVDKAKERGLTPGLIDREITITLKRAAARIGFFTKAKLLGGLFMSFFDKEEVSTGDVEKMEEALRNPSPDGDPPLADAFQALAKELPPVKTTLIDERDVYMAQKLRQTPGDRVVAVVGAGHVPGIIEHLRRDEPIDELDTLPKRSVWPRFWMWAIPAIIVGLFAYGAITGAVGEAAESIWLWILINGILSAVGALIAWGHPITIASAFVAAPLTSLNPLMAAGWVAGLVQAWIRSPRVGDLEDLRDAITTMSGFWKNRATRVLLVVILTNLGSVLGTFIAGSLIAVRTL